MHRLRKQGGGLNMKLPLADTSTEDHQGFGLPAVHNQAPNEAR